MDTLIGFFDRLAVYTPQSLGIKPPSEGFQEGGWYSGRQYIGGTLSDPGFIHPCTVHCRRVLRVKVFFHYLLSLIAPKN